MGWFRRSSETDSGQGKKADASPNEFAKTLAAAAAGDPNTPDLLVAEAMAGIGRPQAMHDMGVTYQEQNNWPKAIESYRAATEKGAGGLAGKSGHVLCRGPGRSTHYAEAVRWFRKAADQGDGGGCFTLGIMFPNSWGLPQDYNEAFSWVDKAAQQGNQEAWPRGTRPPSERFLLAEIDKWLIRIRGGSQQPPVSD